MDFIPSSGPHLHIVLNHLPVYGTVIALGLFLYAINWKSWLSSNVEVISKDIEKVSLVLFVLLGILSIPTYISGAAARWAYQGLSLIHI